MVCCVPVLVVAFVLATALPSRAAVAAFSESFERGAVGTEPTAANTAYDQTIGSQGDGNGTVRVAFAASGRRGNCAAFSVPRVSGVAFGFLGERVNRQTVIYLRRYYKVSALPTYWTSILLYKYGGSGNGQLGGTHNGSFAVGGTAQYHKFTLINNNTRTTTSNSSVPLNAWFRVEVQLSFGANSGTQTVRLYLGANLNGTTPSETFSGPLTGSYTDYIEDGILTNPAASFVVQIDEAANGASWPGPLT
jgi:hypothetical protein